MAKFTVDFADMPGSPVEYLSPQGIVVTRYLQCDYTDRIVLAKELIGWSLGDILHPPDEYYAGDEPLYYIYAREVTIDPIIGLDSGTGNYKKAKLTVIYKNLEYDAPPAGDVTYVTESLEPAAEFITLSEEKLYWDNAQAIEIKATEVPTKIIRMFDWVYTLNRMLTLPDAVFTLPGKVNNATVYSYSLNKSFAAETLLCGNPSLQREVTSSGITAWTITFRFTYREQGWNNFPRMSDAGGALLWGAVYSSDGTEKVVYETASFGTLVR